MLHWLIDFSLRHRFLVIAVVLALAAVGAVSLGHLNIEAFPDTTPVQVQVNTVASSAVSLRNSRYPSGSMIRSRFIPSTRPPNPILPMLFRVRGCIGKTIGKSAWTCSRASKMRPKMAGSSTLLGR